MTLRRTPLALAVPILAAASAAASPAAGLDVEDEEFAFEPARIEAEAGEKVAITFANTGTLSHTGNPGAPRRHAHDRVRRDRDGDDQARGARHLRRRMHGSGLRPDRRARGHRAGPELAAAVSARTGWMIAAGPGRRGRALRGCEFFDEKPDWMQLTH